MLAARRARRLLRGALTVPITRTTAIAVLALGMSGCDLVYALVRALLTRDPALRMGNADEARSARSRAHERGCDELLRLVGD